MRDPYAVLSLPRDASDEDVKRAYRRLAKRLHPDLNPGKRAAQAQFSEINAAYAILSDPVKRRRYDRGEIDADGRERGFAGFGAGSSGAGARQGRHSVFNDFSIDEVFQEFLHRGRRGAGAGAQPGGGGAARSAESRTEKLTLSFLDAALGGKRPVTLGEGRSVEVSIPAGIEPGQKLRLKNAQTGDVLLEVAVEPHPVFARKERDIHAEAVVPLAEAVLGGSLVVPTIHGDVTLKIPKGTNTGATLRLRGKGIVAGGTSGDHYVKLNIALPEPPDPELAAFLERWAAKRKR